MQMRGEESVREEERLHKDERARKELRETQARLTAPQHLVTTRFEEHRKIEGYEQDRSVPDFYGCDRLWKLDTLYGRVQMGYHPGRGQSFLFANIKTSLFDTAPALHQHQLKETQQMRALKSGNQNVAYTSRRRADSAVLLYKAENKPWSEQSLAPYLARTNLETLRKTLPFLDRSEAQELQQTRQERKELESGVRQSLQARQSAETAALRLRQRELSYRQNALGAVLYRKLTQSQLFFRKINIAFDLQKAKMFAYYRDVRRQRAAAALNLREMEESAPDGSEKRRDN